MASEMNGRPASGTLTHGRVPEVGGIIYKGGAAQSGSALPRLGGKANVAHMMEKPAMSDEYARGRRDGLRMALSILEAEEAKWEALLGESPSWRTNATRAIRHKAYQVARKRMQTALNRLLPKSESALPVEVASMIDQAGL
jgi:hypothetical protein